MKKIILTFLCLITQASITLATQPPSNLILIIRDGASYEMETLARHLTQKPKLHLDPYLTGQVLTEPSTNSEGHNITDSAASATAYACGISTFNGYVGLDKNQQPCLNLVEIAKAQSKVTAVITNTTLPHATPAAFTAHQPDRNLYEAIALDQLDSADYLAGGGLNFYQANTREDKLDLLQKFRDQGFQIITTNQEFQATQNLGEKALVLLGPDHHLLEIDRACETRSDCKSKPDGKTPPYPRFQAWGMKLVELILKNPKAQEKGFFIMIEEGRADHAGHHQDPASAAHQILAADHLFNSLKKMIETNPTLKNTSIVVVSDHATGGFTIGREGGYQWNPEFIREVRASALWMAEQYLQGQAPEKLLKTYTPIQELTQSEEILLRILPLFKITQDPSKIAPIFGQIISLRAGLGTTTFNHTGESIPLYVYGPHWEDLRGTWKVEEIFGGLKKWITREGNKL